MTKEEFQALLDHSVKEARAILPQGKVADYIPELKKAKSDQLGIVLTDLDGNIFASGDTEQAFTMQSIVKVFALIYALETLGEDVVFEKVGMEPSGASFMEMTTLSDFSDKPSNPLINAGALVIASMISQDIDFQQFLDYISGLCASDGLKVNEAVFDSELNHSERNHALSWELKRLHLLTNSLEDTLLFYTRGCAVELTARELSRFAVILANGGFDPLSGEQKVDPDVVKTTLTLLFTCGLYNGTGEFAVRIGLPAKSGVGGGILAAAHQRFGIGAFGPSLDIYGNSIGAIKVLSELSAKYDWHTFAWSK